MNCDLAIEALHKGREKFPIKIAAKPFDPAIPGSACAIGAIAAGLGYIDSNSEDTIYTFVKNKLSIKGDRDAVGEGPSLSMIYLTNDNCFQWDDDGVERLMLCDPDEAVINRLREECK